jgi:hypothetical protein
LDDSVSSTNPCPQCGEAVRPSDRGVHKCEEEEWLIFQMAHLTVRVQQLEPEIRAYLDSPRGRFEAWCAKRERRK